MSVISKSPPPQQKKLKLVKAKLTPSMISNTDTLHFKKNRYIIIEHNRKSKYILLEN